MKKIIEEQSLNCCTGCQKLKRGIPIDSSLTSQPSVEKRCPVPKKYVLNNPEYVDPLYRPYHTDYSKSPYIHPGVGNTGYPLVDPYRRRMGWGQIFRSQHEGICPLGFRPGARNLCIPLEPESWGTFYTNENTNPLLQYSNCKIPYNANGANPCKWKVGPWNKTICGGVDDSNNNDDQLVFGANGHDNSLNTKQAECMTKYFW